MLTIVIADRDTADVYDTHPALDSVEYLTSLDMHDVVASDPSALEAIPPPLLEPWQQFVRRVFDGYEVRGALEQHPRVYDACDREVTFAQLVSRATDLFAPVADVV